LEDLLHKHRFMENKTVIRGVALILFAILFGAFLAHSLEQVLSPKQLISFETGVKYQFYSGFFLFILGLNREKFTFSINWVANLFFLGSCLFSFSIYLLNLFSGSSFTKILGPITPIGGLLMIVALALFLFKLMKPSKI
jgi:uncharacterized membrane protein YgdD (TMEM256/DUF423 family)